VYCRIIHTPIALAGAPMITAHASTTARTSVREARRRRRGCGSNDMSDYSDDRTPQTQLLSTPTIAFAFVIFGAWAASAIFMIAATWSSNSYDDLISDIQRFSIVAAIFGFLGATAAALLELMFGASLSRQFCWVFTIAGTGLAIPVLMFLLFRTLAAMPRLSVFSIFGRMGFAAVNLVVLLTLVDSILCGVVLGVMLTRRRLGFGPAARRASRIAFIWSVVFSTLLELAWTGLFALFGRGGRSEIFFSLDVFGLGMILIGVLSIVSLVYSERPVGQRFEVLPVQRPLAEAKHN
jgi:hypothetical protein